VGLEAMYAHRVNITNPTQDEAMARRVHQTEDAKEIRSKAILTFPDGSTFPVVEARETGVDHIFAKYLSDGKPQALWVPRGFVSTPSP
jgi:hypothetical protein